MNPQPKWPVTQLDFPSTLPSDPTSAAFLSTLQHSLLLRAEQEFGPRDARQLVKLPIFELHGPRIINIPGGAYATLSLNAAQYWPTVVYELAHETIHLLDPVVGYTTFMEEGSAVAFSVCMSAELTPHPMSPPPHSIYGLALDLVRTLPEPTFDSIMKVRKHASRLSAVTAAHLKQLFPNLDDTIASKLSQKCIGR